MSKDFFSHSVVLTVIAVALMSAVGKTIPASHASSPQGVCAMSI